MHERVCSNIERLSASLDGHCRCGLRCHRVREGKREVVLLAGQHRPLKRQVNLASRVVPCEAGIVTLRHLHYNCRCHTISLDSLIVVCDIGAVARVLGDIEGIDLRTGHVQVFWTQEVLDAYQTARTDLHVGLQRHRHIVLTPIATRPRKGLTRTPDHERRRANSHTNRLCHRFRCLIARALSGSTDSVTQTQSSQTIAIGHHPRNLDAGRQINLPESILQPESDGIFFVRIHLKALGQTHDQT